MVRELEAAKKAREEKEQLWMEYQALLPTAGSPKMDGMPRAGSCTDANPAIVDLRTEAEARYKEAFKKWQEAESAARKQMTRLSPWLYSLCLYFYLNGMTKEKTCELMQISEATFKRYKAALKNYEPS